MNDTIIANIENIVNAENFTQPNLSGFSEACFESNTEAQLLESLNLEFVDRSDCNQWGIDANEWRNEMKKALICLVADRLEID